MTLHCDAGGLSRCIPVHLSAAQAWAADRWQACLAFRALRQADREYPFKTLEMLALGLVALALIEGVGVFRPVYLVLNCPDFGSLEIAWHQQMVLTVQPPDGEARGSAVQGVRWQALGDGAKPRVAANGAGSLHYPTGEAVGDEFGWDSA